MVLQLVIIGALSATGAITGSMATGSLAASNLTGDIADARMSGDYTGITSIYNTNLALGRSSTASRIDFSTANQVKVIQSTASALNTPLLSLVNNYNSNDADTCMDFVQHDYSWALGIKGNSNAFEITYNSLQQDADLDDISVIKMFRSQIAF